MAGFGGSVKLTGESEYRKALMNITQDLKSMSSALKAQAADFNSSDKSLSNAAAKQKELSKAIGDQQSAISKAQYALSQYSVALQAQQTRHNALNKEYKNAINELDRIGKTLGTTSKEYQEQAKVVDRLEGELVESTDEMNKSKSAMAALKSEINSATKTMNAATQEIDDLGKETEETGKQAQNAGEGFTVFKGIVANLASSAITAAVSGMKKLASSIVSVGKQAYSSYASYEQLVGGVETLFGKSADELMKYANEAYKTAGLSANEYMEQATSFSATLLQGLGGDTKKAVEYANMAIIDMSDNANKMGTDMYMIQNAYQGFAKQNYTMLDNLKLGYGGTQAEMARLINDTGVLGKSVKVTAKTVKDVPFNKIIEAIHKAQQEIGITGTTSLEAAQTIEGSTKSVSASWKNLLTGIADENANLHDLIKKFMDNVVVMAKNSVPRIKQVVTGLGRTVKELLHEFAPEVAKTVLPALEKVANAVKSLGSFIIDNFSKIVPIVLTAAGAFAAINAAMAIAGTIKTVTTAIAGLEAGVGLVTKAQTVWNAAMSANPIGAVIAAVALLTTAVIALAGRMSETDESIKETQKALDDQAATIDANAKSWQNLKDSQQKAMDSGMTELSYYENLASELEEIVDANGKVKEGYEDRASFITTKLSEALGIEIQNTGSIIKNYKTLQDEIDKVMEKKKAQIILDSQESLYKEAINNQTNALMELNKASQTVAEEKAKLAQVDEEYAAVNKELNELMMSDTAEYSKFEIGELAKQATALGEKRLALEKNVASAEDNYNKQKDLLSEYAYNIGQYEQNMALAHKGAYDEMTTVNWEYVKDYENAADAEKKKLEDQVAATETNLNLLKELKKKNGSDIYDEQIKASEKQLKEQKDAIKKYESATKTGLDDVELAWSDSLDDQLSEITGKKVEFRDAGKDQVQMFVDSVEIGKPKAKKEMAKLVKETITEITDQQPQAKVAGENLLEGVNSGIKNQNKQSSVFSSIASFGSKLLSKLRQSLKENSPSKATNEMGQFLLEGLTGGIEDEESATLKKVGSFGQSVISTLNSELAQGANIGNIGVNSKISGNSVAQNSTGYDNMVSAFKDALSQMKIELDDEVAGRFIERTVTRVIYA